MKTIKSTLLQAMKLILILTIICGVIYPLVVTGVSQLFFKDKANGSIIEVDVIKYGSELLGQQYIGNEYMWGRLMNIDTQTFKDENGNSLMYAVPSNLSTADEKYKNLIDERIEKIKKADPAAQNDQIPVDLVTCSGSGMDPHISVAAAEYQVERIAQARNISKEKVQEIIDKYTTKRLAGIFGENVVNVLQVNLALDGKIK